MKTDGEDIVLKNNNTMWYWDADIDGITLIEYILL